MTITSDSIEQSIAAFSAGAQRLEDRLNAVVLGQEMVVREAIVALLSGGHVLLEGVPGLGKTLLIRTLADALDLSFSRIQFTPDLMPADITGNMILREDEAGHRRFEFQAGPVFGNLVLADEVNRATPKTQSALLEAMQEQTVTIGGQTRPLPAPFFVMATQNPLEMEGTYPLPEAQLDRFLLKVIVPFPSRDTLRAIGRQSVGTRPDLEPVVGHDELRAMMEAGRLVPVATPVLDYAVSVVLGTHPGPDSINSVRRYVRAGASPRGLQALIAASQVRALLDGRLNVAIEDIRALALPTLRHRILLTFEGQAEGITADEIVAEVLDAVPG